MTGEIGKLETALLKVVQDNGMDLVDIELQSERGGRVLRLFVDRPGEGGVSVEDCARVSRDCSALLDVEDLVDGRYRLEVSSPGIERRLRRPEDFLRHLDERVRVVLAEAIEGRRKMTGTLARVTDDAIELELASGETRTVPLEKIRRANLKVF